MKPIKNNKINQIMFIYVLFKIFKKIKPTSFYYLSWSFEQFLAVYFIFRLELF